MSKTWKESIFEGFLFAMLTFMGIEFVVEKQNGISEVKEQEDDAGELQRGLGLSTCSCRNDETFLRRDCAQSSDCEFP